MNKITSGPIFATLFYLGWVTTCLSADEFRARILESQQQLHLGQTEQAIKILQEAESQTRFGSEEHVEARTLLFIAKLKASQCDIDLGIDVLFESVSLEVTNRNLYDEVQFNIIDKMAIAWPLRHLDKSTSLEAREQKILETAMDLENRMIERGISVGIAKLALFGPIQFAVEYQNFTSAQALLKQLEPIISSPHIAVGLKALLWNNWAAIHLPQRHFAEALYACRQFEEAARHSQDITRIAFSQNQLAQLYLRMGDYANAKQLLESIREAQSQHTNLEQKISWKINFAKSLEGERQFLDARVYLQEGRKILDDLPDSSSMLKALVLNNLGVNYYLTGELEESKVFFENSRRLLDSQDRSRTLIAAESMINQGWLELALQQSDDAARHFDEAALIVAESASENHVRFAEALAGASRAYLAVGDRLNAVTKIRRAEHLAYAKLLHDLHTVVDPRDRIAILQETRVHPESIVWPGVFDTFLELAISLDIPVSEQWEVVLRWKGILNRLENTSQRQEFFRNIAEVRTLEQRLSEVYFFRPRTPAEKMTWLQEIQTIEVQLRDLRRRSELPQNQANTNDSQEKPIDWLNSLPDDLGVLSIVQIRTYRSPSQVDEIGASGEFIGFVAAGGKLSRVSFGSTTQLESAVLQWRSFLMQNHVLERRAAERVAKILRRPLLPFVQDLHRLAIDADGICHTVAWGALPGLAPDDFWIDHLLIESVYDLSTMQPKAAKYNDQSLLVVGDVDYGPLSSSWQKLPAAADEIQAIQSTFQVSFPTANIDLLQSELADKLSVTRRIPGKRVVHLSTHGFYRRGDSSDSFGLSDATSLLETGLVFAAPQSAPAIGITAASQYLTASDVMAMELEGVELVVLSACETGLGKVKAGQGMDSLVASFHSAGAHRVVSSLWKIGDAETVELMRRFYTNLWNEELSVADALRRTQRELIRDSDSNPEWKNPAVWAAFTVSNRKID